MKSKKSIFRPILKAIRRLFKALLRQLRSIALSVVRSFLLELRQGQSIVDTAWDIHLENQDQLMSQKIQQIKQAKIKEELPASSSPALPADYDPEVYLPFGLDFIKIEETEGHFLTEGVTGSGKGILTQITMAHVLGLKKRRVVVIDSKQDTLPILHGMNIPYKYFNIASNRGVAWDIAKDAGSYTKLPQIAAILLPADEKATDNFWLFASRALLVAIMRVFIYLFGDDWAFHDVIKAATFLSREELITFLKQCPGNEAIVHSLFSEEVEKATANVMLEVFTKLERLNTAAVHSQQATEKISLKEFMEQDDGVLVIGMDLTEKEAHNPMIHAIFRRLSDFILALPDYPETKTWIFIDEVIFLGYLPGLLDLMIFGRSKNALVSLALQGIEGMIEIYRKNFAEIIVEMCRYKTILRSTAVTAKWVSSLFGKVDVYDSTSSDSFGSQGISGGSQVRKQGREKYYDSTFLNIPLPSRKKGLTGFFITPDTAEKRHISGEMLDNLKPKTVEVSKEECIDNDQQLLMPWTEKEKAKFIYGDRKEEEVEINDLLDEQMVEYFLNFTEEFARKLEQKDEHKKEDRN